MESTAKPFATRYTKTRATQVPCIYDGAYDSPSQIPRDETARPKNYYGSCGAPRHSSPKKASFSQEACDFWATSLTRPTSRRPHRISRVVTEIFFLSRMSLSPGTASSRRQAATERPLRSARPQRRSATQRKYRRQRNQAFFSLSTRLSERTCPESRCVLVVARSDTDAYNGVSTKQRRRIGFGRPGR